MDVKKIDSLIALYEKRVSTLKGLKSLIESDPDLALEVVQAFMPDGSSLGLANHTRTPKKAGQYDKMLKFMKDGEWRTSQEIADGIGEKKTSIAPYLYRDETKDQFDSRKHPERSRMVQWRLKKPPEQPGGISEKTP